MEKLRDLRPFRWPMMDAFGKMRFFLSVGLNHFEIAERLNCHRVTISRWKKQIRGSYLAQETKRRTNDKTQPHP